MKKPIRLALLNPNANAQTTKMMCKIAICEADADVEIDAITMESGPPFISEEVALAAAAELIVEAGVQAERRGVDGIIVAGFGDPGLFELREKVDIPVTGIAEAGMATAAKDGRRFSIITTTPNLRESIERSVRRYGHIEFLCGVHITPGDAEFVMSDPDRMSAALLKIAHQSVETDKAEAILIGGGPLAQSAHRIAAVCKVPIIEPVLEGVRLALMRVQTKR